MASNPWRHFCLLMLFDKENLSLHLGKERRFLKEYKEEVVNFQKHDTVLCISLETLIVTYKEKYNFQHDLADVESAATPMTVWLLKDIDKRFPKR